MLYHLFEWLEAHNYDIPGAGLFKYVSFRAGMAIVMSLVIALIFGRRIVRFLRDLQIGETVRDLGLEGQKQKQGTPTMGGIIIIMAIIIPTLLFCRLDNVYIVLMILATSWMGVVGFTDDYIKVFKKNKKGLPGIFKVVGQVSLGLIVSLIMLKSDDIVVRMDKQTAVLNNYEIIKTVYTRDAERNNRLREMVFVKAPVTNVPFYKNNELDYSKFLKPIIGEEASRKLTTVVFIILVILIITAVSNAANLTDGIDGLAAGTSAIIGATLAVLAYATSNSIFSNYLNILYIPESEELVIFAAVFFAACIGFMWYNSYPAQVFMGDTGSLTLGSIIAVFAILIRKELLIPILCGIFVAENLSVMLQVGYFKYTKRKYGEGRRIFLMSPLHHHFQKKGIPEAKLVTRFWIIGVLLAVLTIITLKIR
jgi:phospho-N-acetylmuramoyl-pentapeptide-transferase